MSTRLCKGTEITYIFINMCETKYMPAQGNDLGWLCLNRIAVYIRVGFAKCLLQKIAFRLVFKAILRLRLFNGCYFSSLRALPRRCEKLRLSKHVSCIGHGELNKFCSIIVLECTPFFLRYLKRIKRVYKSCVNYESKIHAFFSNVNSRLKN